jgi:isopropylmalate/homocitrate/citramalate synthase
MCPKRQKIHKYISPVLFDVTLRDGLQALSSEEAKKYTLDKKPQLFYKMLYQYNPNGFEIGSLVNPKVYPVFKDTIQFHQYLRATNPHLDNLYVLVPNKSHLYRALGARMTNLSFITSISDAFQHKNTRMTVQESRNHIFEMMVDIDFYRMRAGKNQFNIKIYISCINECPITGKIDEDIVIDNLHSFIRRWDIHEVTLSDTCGTLTFESFAYILNNCLMMYSNVDKLALHLHTASDYDENTEKIIHYALDNGLNRFDVSHLESGGCSATMDKTKLKSNLTYKQFYYYYCKYIDERTKSR